MKCMIFIMVGIAMVISVNAEPDFTHKINKSNLPLLTTDNITIISYLNGTINFTDDDFTQTTLESRISNNGTTEYGISVFVGVPDYVEVGNYTQQIQVNTFSNFSITNSSLNSSTIIEIFIQIYDTTYNPHQVIQTGVNTFDYVLCDLDLPFNTTFNTSFSSTYETTSTCDEFLTCPNLITPDMTTIDIFIELPITLTPGIYTRDAIFGVDDNSNITFNFEIKDCIGNVTDVCKEIQGVPDLVICERKYIKNLIMRNTSNIIRETKIEYINTTEVQYKEVLDIGDPDKARIINNIENVSRELLLTTSRLRNIETQYEKKDDELKIANQEKQSAVLSLPILVQQSVSNLTELNKNLTDKNKELEKTSWNKYKVVFFSLIVIGLVICSFLLYRYKKNKFL